MEWKTKRTEWKKNNISPEESTLEYLYQYRSFANMPAFQHPNYEAATVSSLAAESVFLQSQKRGLRDQETVHSFIKGGVVAPVVTNKVQHVQYASITSADAWEEPKLSVDPKGYLDDYLAFHKPELNAARTDCRRGEKKKHKVLLSRRTAKTLKVDVEYSKPISSAEICVVRVVY